MGDNNNENINRLNESIQENIKNYQNNQNNQNNQNFSGIPKNMKITSWILFFISIIFSILLI
jgi:hypothetical protein